MTWTAPAVERNSPPSVAGEREALEGWLDFHRDTLLGKCSGLTAPQLKLRSVPPSTLSLLGLVRHMAEVERWWFRTMIPGNDHEALYWSDASADGDFDNLDDADAQADFEVFHREVAAAKESVAGRSLDDTFVSPRGNTLDVRWVFVHMIEEYARHNGHADLLREVIDGTVGA